MSGDQIPSDQPTPKKAKKEAGNQYPDRLKVSPEALQRLKLWNDQAIERLRGVKITRSDLLNFLILNHEESLSPAELKELEIRYFDEVKYAQWALEELKAAKSRGEVKSLADILGMRATCSEKGRTRSRKSKANSGESDLKDDAAATPHSQDNTSAVDNPVKE